MAAILVLRDYWRPGRGSGWRGACAMVVTESRRRLRASKLNNGRIGTRPVASLNAF
jgi:hypothetical protein